MKKCKKFILGASIALMGMFAVGCSNTNAANTSEQVGQGEAAAKVGDTVISNSKLDKDLAYFEQLLVAQYGEDYKANEEALTLYNDQREKVLNYLVETQLVLNDATKQGIEVSTEKVEEEFNKTKLQFESDEAFAEALTAEGLTPEAFKEEIQTSLVVNEMILKITDGIEATDQEIEDFYNQNIEGYTVSPGAEIAHILVATEEEAKKVKEEYDAGTSFEELAATYGTDGTKDIGGALGFIPYDSVQYDADFLAGAKTLEEGQVSDPVKTQFGFHLIKVTNVQKEAQVKSLEEVKEAARESVITSKQMEVFNTYLEDLKASTTVEIY